MKSDITGKTSILINAPIHDVWNALTNPDIIKQYFFNTNVISDWKEGSPIVFRGEWEGKVYEDKGTILNVIPERLFRYNHWSSMSGIEDKPENYAIITYSLSEAGEDTELSIIQENIPDDKTKEHSVGNWNKVLTDLKTLLEK